MLLGIGGVRAMRAYCELTGDPAPEVFHTNEGHAGFLGLERIRELVERTGLTFDEALEAVRAGTVFTTHTPVPAGIDRFPRDLIEPLLRRRATPRRVPGRPHPRARRRGRPARSFNMAHMGLRLGAARQRRLASCTAQVSRGMFAGLWPGFDADEVPISSVTNGVHAPTWVGPRGRSASPSRSAARS